MKRRMQAVVDQKNKLSYSMLNWINQISVAHHFADIRVEGAHKLPKGPFILISNHTTRWDGPIVQTLIGRPANYMVSPNELRGLQGFLLRTFGAFPADPKLDLLVFMKNQAAKNEVIVIFPEGNIYRDGTTHHFKPGAARTALLCADSNLNVPIVPIAVDYSRSENEVVRIMVGDPIDVRERVEAYRRDPSNAIYTLSQQLHREVCHLRAALGSRRDRETVFEGKPIRSWAHHATMT